MAKTSPGDIVIDAMARSDWPAVSAIYAAGISTDNATFETEVPGWEAWDAAHRPDCRLVARTDGAVVGWAALAPISRRPAYAGVAENSVYVAPGHAGRGIGTVLLEALVRCSEEAGVWMLQTSIFPENGASLRLHVACGFRVVGRRERIGQHGALGWRDTLLMERRSARAGVD